MIIGISVSDRAPDSSIAGVKLTDDAPTTASPMMPKGALKAPALFAGQEAEVVGLE
jgi:hypothetical protein